MTIRVVVHGGAGTLARSRMTPDQEAAFRAGLRTALLAGHRVLAAGGSALDAATEAVAALEDDMLFNAGRGAVYATNGRQEMDAAVMEGHTHRAGAVAGVCGPRNPVRAARAVMRHAGEALLAGDGAHLFLRSLPPGEGVAWEDPEYFADPARLDAMHREVARQASAAPDTRDDADRHGTVGAVALDAAGHLAAATSTGGLTAKKPGRIGDTPVIGAGTLADLHCAVSCTGNGEAFIRHSAAHEISARLRLAGQSLTEATEGVIAELAEDNGSGGLIALGRDGQIAMPFNSNGMYRGTIGADGVAWTGIYDDPLEATESVKLAG